MSDTATNTAGAVAVEIAKTVTIDAAITAAEVVAGVGLFLGLSYLASKVHDRRVKKALAEVSE